MNIDPTNQQLLALLSQNARQSTSALARQLNLSRTAVQERITRLENEGIIAGYQVVINQPQQARLLRAWVIMKIKQKLRCKE